MMNGFSGPAARRGKPRWSLALVAAVLALAVSGVVPGLAVAQSADKIKIVSSLPRTGSSKGQTDTVVNGIRMALDEAGWSVAGYTIEYEDMDDATAARGAWDAAKEAENANKALNDPDVMVYLGTFNSGAAKVAIPILNQDNLAMISPANTYPGLTKAGKGEPGEPDIYYPNGNRNYFRVVPADDLQGAVGAYWAAELGVQRVYVLDDTELYGHGIAQVFAQTAPQYGIQIVGGPEGIDPKATDYRALAQRIRARNPEMIYFGGITQNNAGKLWQDLRSVMRNVIMMGPDGIFEDAFLQAAGEAAEGTFVTFGGLPPEKYSGTALEWLHRYRAIYNAEPEAYAIYGYEAAKVALAAIERAGKDRNAIRMELFNTQSYNGVLGMWSFNHEGDTSLATMSGNQVLGSKFRFSRELTPP